VLKEARPATSNQQPATRFALIREPPYHPRADPRFSSRERRSDVEALKCAHCGLINSPHEARCRRCGAPFSASPFVDALRQEGPPWEATPYYGSELTSRQFGLQLVDRDAEHLKILSICYYVLGGFSALFALIPVLHLIMGIAIVAGGFDGPPGNAPPEWFGWIFIIVAATVILFCEALAISTILTGRFLARRRRYIFCFVVACLNCIHFPFGTALGVFTLLVLTRSSVKAIFGRT
jgi:hypothetical protein